VASLVALTHVEVMIPGLGVARPAISLLEWIDGAQPLASYIYHEVSGVGRLIELIDQAFQGLGHVHEKGLIHWDLKSDNCLVGIAGRVKLVDIGNARDRMDSGSVYVDAAPILTSRQNAPRELIQLADAADDSRRIEVQLPAGRRTMDTPAIDLFMLGKTIARILGLVEERSDKAADERGAFLARVFSSGDEVATTTLQLLTLIVRRLTSDEALEADSTFYRSSSEVLQDLRKLLPEFGAAGGVEELHGMPQHIIRLPVERNVAFTPRIGRLVNSGPVGGLQKHLQLGLTRVAFPGAKHDRFEHVLGVLGTSIAYVRALYSDRTNPVFRLLCDQRDIEALLFAATVHDVGHGAFSHYLEECPPLFRGCAHEDYAQALLRGDRALFHATIENFDDERNGLLVSAQDWISDSESPANFLLRVANILRPRTPAYESHDLSRRDHSDLARLHILHSIIDSSLDADKLDYLRRDAVHSALDYASGIDVDRFLQSLTVATSAPPATDAGLSGAVPFSPTIAVSAKGLLPLESLIQARYQMFSALYWQHTARAATAVLQYLVWRVLQPAEGDEPDFEERRSMLLAAFRRQDDAESLRWLVSESGGTGNAARLARALTQRAADGSADLPYAICELSHAELFSVAGAMTRYERILFLHEELLKFNPADYGAGRASILKYVTRALRELKTRAPSLNPDAIDETSVFIDVPEGSKDQVKNLFVVSSAGARSFVRYSPLAEATREAFAKWSRRVRVFALPEVADALLRDIPAEELSICVFEALFDAYEAVVGAKMPQQPLPGLGAPPLE